MERMHIFSFLAREVNLNYSVMSTTPTFHSQLDKLIRVDWVLLGDVSRAYEYIKNVWIYQECMDISRTYGYIKNLWIYQELMD